ncbi:MAG: polyprenyl diphosphate synthase [Candidatus Aenigmatarchaeota archaeon]
MRTLNESENVEYTALKEQSVRHLGIIMDGNRRFAKRLMLEPWKGHEWGQKKVDEVLGWCADLGIKTVTLYTLSLENIAGRPRIELEYLYKLMEKVACDVISNKHHNVHARKVRVKIIGKTETLPKKLRMLLAKVEELTKDYNGFEANFAIAYGSRTEIVDAVKNIAAQVKAGAIEPSEISESTLRENFYNPQASDPELIIRTGGEKRLSNFLLFQSAYSELCFIKKSWPEFSKNDLVAAIKDFNMRQRRFGA